METWDRFIRHDTGDMEKHAEASAKRYYATRETWEVRYLQVHVVDEAPFKRERRQSSDEGDEVTKKREQGPQEGADSNVRGASDETHKHAVTRPLMIPLPCKVRVHEFIDWTGIDLPTSKTGLTWVTNLGH